MTADVLARWAAVLAAAEDPAQMERDAALVALRLVRAGLGAADAAQLARATVLGLDGRHD